MKKTVFKLLTFLLLFVAVDVVSGKLLPEMMSRAKPSSMKNMCDLANEAKPDIVILGSSRAMHHYDSRIIQDSLGLTCMNYGAMSNGIVLMYGRYKLLTRHHTPKMIVYDIHPPFDLEIGDNSKYIPTLRPFAYDKEIKDYICSIEDDERFKLYSHIYRFNGMFQELLAVQFKADNQLFNGYSPLYGKMKVIPKQKEGVVTDIDTVKLNLFKEMISDCCKRGIKICFFVSPSYHQNFSKSIKPLINLCREFGVFLKSYDGTELNLNICDFYDSSHLNDNGVKQYTKEIIPYLRNILNKQQ